MGIAHFIRAQAYWAHPLDEKLSPQMRSREGGLGWLFNGCFWFLFL